MQVNFAKNYKENYSTQIGSKVKKIILINGAPGNKEDGSFFFFDQAGEISRKLSITKVPSVVRQAPNDTQILIEEIALDELEENSHLNHQEQTGGLDE